MEGISKRLVAWYLQNHRNLPWRDTNDPYLIWISEIILQQTQVTTGTAYYLRITQEYPAVGKLAAANLDELLKLWQGLGYYSRARYMHQAAQQIMSQHQGRFPDTYKKIRSLKGIGDYTAAAIASLAFNLPHAAVDGNVYRVIARLFGIDTPIDNNEGKKAFQRLADQLLDPLQPGSHNQAMMELGALVCRPANPLCDQCPLQPFCGARRLGIQSQLPVKSRKTQTRMRHLNYILVSYDNLLFIAQRHDNDIWRNLFELPLVESEKELNDAELVMLATGLVSNDDPVEVVSINRTKHLLSHQTLLLSFTHLKPASQETSPSKWMAVDPKDLANYAFPKPIADYLANKF
ncbi:MAG: A/G-specific adenine glycosylase [Breznakibacter sp.]